MSRHAGGVLGLLLLGAACSGAIAPATGRQAFPLEMTSSVKSRAVRGAVAEISLSSDNGGLRYGIYLDTLIGPTPEEYLYQWSHPRAWLGAMVDAKLVDGVFGVPAHRSGLPRQAFAIEVGEPFPAGADTVAIVYAWCVRRFPVIAGSAGPPSVWRDTFIPADSGWTRVSHTRTIASTACVP